MPKLKLDKFSTCDLNHDLCNKVLESNKLCSSFNDVFIFRPKEETKIIKDYFSFK